MFMTYVEHDITSKGMRVFGDIKHDSSGVLFVHRYSSKDINYKILRADEEVQELLFDWDSIDTFLADLGEKMAWFFEAEDLFEKSPSGFFTLLANCLVGKMVGYCCYMGDSKESTSPYYVYVIGEPEYDSIDKAIDKVREEWKANSI